ncbi:PEPxxWA-CTERM sorting domain-containing protein [Sandarakinorhabdus sp. DWP1-3-1]|uniref:PEPxxWA-CTERM sorting domain-containing protein n=1 Tax=Sandarakinorhabdus sp. DWP1-3-1 TaxID=2804627 RepID=UPI003CEBEBFB
MNMKMGLVAAVAFGALALAPAGMAAAAVIDVGPQTGTFTSNTRGYWFTAPVDFYITGLFVPTDASIANQNIAVLRLSAAPPQFAATTNDFTTLALIRDNSSAGFISTSIQFLAGDVVGILGSRGTTNSYGAGNYASAIGGNAVTLARFGMQFPLATVDPQDLWTEAGGSISRVEFSYELGRLAAPGVPEPASWALLIAGFGLTGAAMRRRRVAVAG